MGCFGATSWSLWPLGPFGTGPVAEGAGFEPAVGLPTTAFKAVPIGRSGTPPRRPHECEQMQTDAGKCRGRSRLLPHQVGLGAFILFNRGVTATFRLAPAISARLLGAAVVGVAAVVLIVTALTVALAWPMAVVIVVAAVGMIAAIGSWLYFSRVKVVELSEVGYRVRFLRGAGVNQGRWADVEDVVSAHVSGAVCLAFRLRDGRSTVIPVAALATDRDTFAQQVREHLSRGHGLRPLSQDELPQ